MNDPQNELPPELLSANAMGSTAAFAAVPEIEYLPFSISNAWQQGSSPQPASNWVSKCSPASGSKP
jgi:hypothetical protein